jgi:hypothetical protein
MTKRIDPTLWFWNINSKKKKRRNAYDSITYPQAK